MLALYIRGARLETCSLPEFMSESLEFIFILMANVELAEGEKLLNNHDKKIYLVHSSVQCRSKQA